MANRREFITTKCVFSQSNKPRPGVVAAWVAFDEPISKTLRERGVVGDPSLISDSTMLRVLNEMDTMIGRLCAAEYEMTLRYGGIRH